MRAISEDMRVLARRRLKEAEVLLAAGEWSGAYYLAGYAIECALKACILKSVKKFHMPNKDKINKAWSHDLTALLKEANLTADQQIKAGTDPLFGRYWAVVKDWTETSRYETKSEQDAKELVQAVGARRSGVMTWVKTHW
ncbi:HEPN domain-containing protein [Nocardia lijiangensis]|uniref:HEPN domain-containing protein n=1 Tax=Nocardia lijiangensis TaxID=299618 RepID=UPI0009FDEB2B|nr:HEPN domain-containing protein [Nocardia lijiangensis]